jgi:erythromycin esterase
LIASAAICICIVLNGKSSAAAMTEGSSDQPDVFIAWAGTAAIKLRTVDLDSNEAELAPFRDLIGSAPVVALGEPGHGAHEPLAFRNRLFAYLVERCGFTAIALETSFTESRAVHDFVAGGPGNAADIVHRSLTWGFGDYAENAQLIQWIREYNRHAAGRRKVRFYGIDLSGADNDGDFPHAAVALEEVVKYLRTTAPDASRNLLAGLAPALHRMSAAGYGQLAVNHDPALDAALESLGTFLRTHAAALRRAGNSEYDWAVRGVVAARQLRDMLALDTEPPGNAAMRASDYKKVNVRDAAMADNVLWAKAQEGKDGRILVFAHNAHVMNAPTRGGIWSVFGEPPRMMGQHLRVALGESLIIIGTSAAHSGSGLPEGPALENSVDAALSKLGLPLFVLDLRAASREADALAWLDARRPIRANFNTELDINLRQAFDALVFIDRVTPARKIFDASTR